jgi:hypothetical protein
MTRIEATRQHGPFDPRFPVRGSPAMRVWRRPFFTRPSAPSIRSPEQLAALAAWEADGGSVN